MFNFFVDETCYNDGTYFISGADFNHIKNVLRMDIGDRFLVSCNGKSDLCELSSFDTNTAVAVIVEENCRNAELSVKIHLFQGLPKSDKLELIIQKVTELGASDITPVEMSRSIVKIEDKKKKSKLLRWQAIAESAAKQSKRNIIPTVHEITDFKSAVKYAQKLDLIIVPYENEDGMISTAEALSLINSNMSIGIFIGPEGGFEDSEISLITEAGAKTVSLGKRILRTETAAITSVGMCMLCTEIKTNGDIK